MMRDLCMRACMLASNFLLFAIALVYVYLSRTNIQFFKAFYFCIQNTYMQLSLVCQVDNVSFFMIGVCTLLFEFFHLGILC